METSQMGLNLIKSFEGFRAKAYKLEGEKYFTIGYGHSFDTTIKADTVWTTAQAEAELKKDLKRFESYVDQYAKDYNFKFNQYQFDALVSYCYNRGPGGLRQLLGNSKTVADVAKNIVVYWGSAERYKVGLVRRREAEKVLFTRPVEGSDKVMFKGMELKKGQIGLITVVKPINLWKDNAEGKLEMVRILKPPETYRVYGFREKHDGQYDVGGGHWITNIKTHILYETPSKALLERVKA